MSRSGRRWNCERDFVLVERSVVKVIPLLICTVLGSSSTERLASPPVTTRGRLRRVAPHLDL